MCGFGRTCRQQLSSITRPVTQALVLMLPDIPCYCEVQAVQHKQELWISGKLHMTLLSEIPTIWCA